MNVSISMNANMVVDMSIAVVRDQHVTSAPITDSSLTVTPFLHPVTVPIGKGASQHRPTRSLVAFDTTTSVPANHS